MRIVWKILGTIVAADILYYFYLQNNEVGSRLTYSKIASDLGLDNDAHEPLVKKRLVWLSQIERSMVALIRRHTQDVVLTSGYRGAALATEINKTRSYRWSENRRSRHGMGLSVDYWVGAAPDAPYRAVEFLMHHRAAIPQRGLLKSIIAERSHVHIEYRCPFTVSDRSDDDPKFLYESPPPAGTLISMR